MKRIGGRSFQLDVNLKHDNMSGLSNLSVRVDINSRARIVTLILDEIDSALIIDLVTRILPEDHGVVVFTGDGEGRNEADSDRLNPAAPAFGLRLHFDDRYFRARVFKLMSGAYTLRVNGSIEERMRMAQASSSRVLETLHEIGIEAVITGDPTTDLDVFIHGTSKSHGGRARVWDIVDAVSTVPVNLVFEDDIKKTALAVLLGEPHLAWDIATRRIVVRPETPE